MAVHGRFEQPCPRCGEKVQRIRYADNETDYCARCQTGGKVLADRSLSRLMKSDWPRTLDELEALKRRKNANLPYLPMQKVLKMRFRISSGVVCPVSESSAQSVR
jgi:Zn-finger nucleic acid-binding protein